MTGKTTGDRPPGRSLATKIAAFGVALTTMTAAAVGAAAFYIIKDLKQQSISAGLRHDLSIAGNHVETVLGELHSIQAGLSANSLLANALVDSQGRSSYLEPFLRDFAGSLPAASVVSLADFKGRIIAGRGSRAPAAEDGEIAKVVATGREAAFSIDGGTDRWVVRSVIPVVYPATGRAEGALVFDVAVSGLISDARGLVDNASWIDLVTGTDDSAGGSAVLNMRSHLALPGALGNLGLAVVAERPRAVLTQTVVALTGYGLLAALAVFGATWLASVRLAARIVGPLTRLGEFARMIDSGGAPEICTDLQKDETEVGRVSRSLAVLLARLRERNLDLANAVGERTRQLTTSESRMRAVVESVADAIITIDTAGRVETFNPAAERMFGFAAAEIIGKELGLLMSEPYRSASGAVIKAYFNSAGSVPAVTKRDLEGQRRDGSVFPIDLALSEMVVPEGRRVIGIVRDITERRRLDQLKSDFVSTVSHELRTPLTSIRGSLGLMLSGQMGTMDAEIRQMAEVSLRNSERLLGLVNDILDIQKIESGKMVFDFGMHEVNALLDQCIEANDGHARASGTDLRVTERCPRHQVYVDPARLIQVLSNLVSNAVKFTNPATPVELGCREVGHEIQFFVRDHGPGIPPEFVGRLFQKFSQADASNTRSKYGTGLGLSISRQLVKRMNGRIWFETPAGGGAMFLVALPLAAVAYDAMRLRATASG